MNSKIAPAILLGFISIGVRTGYGQIALENPELSVPQQCAMRMSEEPLTKKLKLNPAQKKAYLDAVKAYLAESKAREKSKTAKDSDRISCDRKFANACLGTLTVAQKEQLLQLGIPAIGSIALIDPAISTRIGLSPAQVKQITQICRAIAKKDEDLSAMIAAAIESVPMPKPGADATKYNFKCAQIAEMYDGERQRVAREKREADQKILAIMTPGQQTKWVRLSGITLAK